MFTAFMNEAANIFSFYGDIDVNNGVGYAVELWMYKQQKSGKQVTRTIYFIDYRNNVFLVWTIGN